MVYEWTGSTGQRAWTIALSAFVGDDTTAGSRFTYTQRAVTATLA